MNPVGNKLCFVIMSSFLLFCLLGPLFIVNLDGLKMKNCLEMSSYPSEVHSVSEDKMTGALGESWNKVWGLPGVGVSCSSAAVCIPHSPTLNPGGGESL
jgi:hypothetical protein